MKRRILQAVVFTIVCSATWVSLAPMRAQLRGASPTLPPVPSRGVHKAEVKAENSNLAPMKLTDRIVAYATNHQFSAELVGDHLVGVAGSVEVANRIPGLRYMWVIQVQTDDELTSSIKRYDDQLFEVTPVGMQPTFHDFVTVPSGRCWVRLTLCKFPKDLPIAFFESDKTIERYAVYSRSQEISSP